MRIHGYELTLRLADAEKIKIENVRETAPESRRNGRGKPISHPGLGEGGRYHVQTGRPPLPGSVTLTFALAGNQNCGKTTLFNQLTGSNPVSYTPLACRAARVSMSRRGSRRSICRASARGI